MICLLDGTRFYAESCITYKPALRNTPLLVTAGQGISIAANRACTNIGISKFTPIWEEIDRLRVHKGIVYKANFNTFSHHSDRFMTALEKHIQGARSMRYSVDEVFYDISHLHRINVDLNEHVQALRKAIYKETGVPTGAGVGKTLTLAKVASWAAKNSQSYQGQCVLICEKETDTILKQMPVGKLWNIGRQLNKHLTQEGILTAYQLKQCDSKIYQKRYSINVANVISELNGIACLDISIEREKKKQIWSTASYRDRLHHRDDLFAELAHHCAEVMRKIRDQKSEMKTLSVFVSTSKYDRCPPFYRRGELTLENGLTDTSFALQQLRALFDDLLPDNLTKQPIYKVGVGAPGLIDAEVKQFELFNHFDNKDTLNNTLDQLSDRFGKGVIGFASQQRCYHERQGEIEMLELENYYTDIKDIVVVKCI